MSAPRAEVAGWLSGTPAPAPDSGWVALPTRRSPRWFFPRASDATAQGSFLIYHPVTLRSLAGWEVARAMAGVGGFRLLSRYSLLPREVWDAAAPLIPPGGSISVAKANHPGRFLALVVDERGAPLAFVKVARDTIGSRALAMEREALYSFGSLLAAPLFAPPVLDSTEGVLVIGPVHWRKRAFPWRLPEEAAFALGLFFRSTSSGEAGMRGVAHGDFAPWNLLRTDSGWGVVDWENCLREAPPYFDLFHFFVQANSELRRPTKQAILEGLQLKGWVGKAVGAYAAGSDIPSSESKHFLHEYLRISAARLDLSAPRRGARVRSRLAARLQE